MYAAQKYVYIIFYATTFRNGNSHSWSIVGIAILRIYSTLFIELLTAQHLGGAGLGGGVAPPPFWNPKYARNKQQEAESIYQVHFWLFTISDWQNVTYLYESGHKISLAIQNLVTPIFEQNQSVKTRLNAIGWVMEQATWDTDHERPVGAVGRQPWLSVHRVQMECHRRPCHTAGHRGTRQWPARRGNCAVWSTPEDCTLAYLQPPDSLHSFIHLLLLHHYKLQFKQYTRQLK